MCETNRSTKSSKSRSIDWNYRYYTPQKKENVIKKERKAPKKKNILNPDNINMNGFDSWKNYYLSNEDDDKLITGYIRECNINEYIISSDINNLCHNFWGKLQIPKVGDYVQLINDKIGQIQYIGIPDKRKKKERINIFLYKERKEYMTKREYISRVITNPNLSLNTKYC